MLYDSLPGGEKLALQDMLRNVTPSFRVDIYCYRLLVVLEELDIHIKLSELGFLEEQLNIGIDCFYHLAECKGRIEVDSGWQAKIKWRDPICAHLYN